MPNSLTIAQVDSPSALALWHLLSLDAPTVATLWLVFVARTTHTALPPLLAPAMFLAVWLIYAADRLLDAARTQDPARLADPSALEPRHCFHQRHRISFFAAMVVAAISLSCLLFETRLPAAYLPLAAIFLAWFAAVHLPRVPAAARLPKEPVTGLIFAAAVFAPEFPHHLPAAILFALLCAFNCAWIHRWESHAWQTSAPTHPLTRLLVRWIPQLTAVLLLCALCPSTLTAALAMAAAALLLLNRFRSRVTPTTLRAVADLALLTPLLVLPLLAR